MLVSSLPGQWNPNSATAANSKIASASENGANAIQGRSLLVQGILDGKPATGELLTHFDPNTQSFVWLFQESMPSGATPPTQPWAADSLASRNHAFVFAARDGVFLFRSGPQKIRVTSPAGKAANLDDAQSPAIKLLPSKFTSKRDTAFISLAPLMTKYRVVGPSAYMGFPQIQSVTRQGPNWLLTIQLMKKVISVTVGPNLKVTNATVVSVIPK